MASATDIALPTSNADKLHWGQQALASSEATRHDLAFAPQDWPMATSMLGFSAGLRAAYASGGASAGYWSLLEKAWREVRLAGFDWVELSTDCVPVHQFSTAELRRLGTSLTEARLTAAAVCVVRQSIIEPAEGAANVAATARVIDAAAGLGIAHVALGLHDALTRGQQDVRWFWTMPGDGTMTDPGSRARAVAALQTLGAQAGSSGLTLSVELYEDGLLGTADAAVQFIEDVGEDSVGINPDLGNLLRAHEDVEPWEYITARVLPYANYWHVKNYLRCEDPPSGTYFSAPSSLEAGVVDYRRALGYAVSQGYAGTILCEHYGGDSLAMASRHREYLRAVLERIAS